MQTEAEIRKQVETRLRRWGLLVLNGILWVGAAKLLYLLAEYSSFGRWIGFVVLFMLGWAALVGLHLARVLYVELRESLVRRAIERERQFYRKPDTDEKRKHNDDTLHLSDDGELVDFPLMDDEAKQRVKRS